MARPLKTIAGSSFLTNIKELVYGWRRDNKYLYIGYSSKGFSRIYNHDIINKVELILESDFIDIWMPASPNLELYLILKHRPEYNRQGLEYEILTNSPLNSFEEFEKYLTEIKVPVLINNCKYCNNEITYRRKNKVYCNDVCRNSHWIELHPRR